MTTLTVRAIKSFLPPAAMVQLAVVYASRNLSQAAASNIADLLQQRRMNRMSNLFGDLAVTALVDQDRIAHAGKITPDAPSGTMCEMPVRHTEQYIDSDRDTVDRTSPARRPPPIPLRRDLPRRATNCVGQGGSDPTVFANAFPDLASRPNRTAKFVTPNAFTIADIGAQRSCSCSDDHRQRHNHFDPKPTALSVHRANPPLTTGGKS